VIILFSKQIKAFNSIKTPTSLSAVFEYVEAAAADGVIAGLDQLEIADNKLTVQRVPAHAAALLLQPTQSQQPQQPPLPQSPPLKPAPPTTARDPLLDLAPTKVIRLANMTTPDDLADDELYLELKEDVTDECGKYGNVLSVEIPRGTYAPGAGASAGDIENDESVGMVFVYFSDSDGATKAKAAVSGRSFNGNIVKVTFYPEDLFLQKTLVLPAGYVSGASASSALGVEAAADLD
jgi:splicing factor U2AF 65 kDa subunit